MEENNKKDPSFQQSDDLKQNDPSLKEPTVPVKDQPNLNNNIFNELYSYTSNLFNKKRSYWINWITISSLGFHVGAIYSFHAALVMIYLDDGMDVKYKMVLNFLAAPFMILPIYGAIIDTHYVKKWGKSKTYIFLMPLIYCSLLILYSFYADQWIEDLNVWPFFAIFFLINCCLAIYLSAIDAWVPLVFNDEQKAKGSFSRWIGFCLGAFIAYNGFILLNSEKWCKKYLGMESNLITTNGFIYFLISYCLVSIILVFIFVGERIDKNPKVTNFRKIWDATKMIFKKKGTKTWMVIVVFKTFGIDMCMQILSTVLVNEDLDKEVLVNAHTVSGIPILIGMIIIQKFIKKGRIMKANYWLIWLAIPIMALDVYTYYDFKQNGDKNTFYFSCASDIVGGWLKCAWWIFDSAQIAIMVDENMNSTHWAAMSTIYNIANAIPYLVSTMLLPAIGFYAISIIGLIYTLIALPLLYKYFKALDNCSKEDFVWLDAVAEFMKNKCEIKNADNCNKDNENNKKEDLNISGFNRVHPINDEKEINVSRTNKTPKNSKLPKLKTLNKNDSD